jgi:hypothetical protein
METTILNITTGHDFDIKTEVAKACDFIKNITRSALEVCPPPDYSTETASQAPPKYKVALTLNLRFHY